MDMTIYKILVKSLKIHHQKSEKIKDQSIELDRTDST